jgi:DNA adenine methylase
MGSKNRISKHLLPILTKHLKEDTYYVEPFVGGCNMIDKVDHPLRIGVSLITI